VLGRFFGATTDEIDRTELVMLITPHVIRNIDEARSVSDEFKEKFSKFTREIERIRKEREEQQRRQQQQNVPQKPAAPDVESKKVPEKSSSLYYDRAANAFTKAEISTEESPGEIHGAGTQTEVAAAAHTKDSFEAKEATPVLYQDIRQTTSAATRDRFWGVQVKSYPDEATSWNLAKKLIDRGYEAHIIKASVRGQDWYRVRVGQYATEKEAGQLLSVLQSRDGFSDAFIVLGYRLEPYR
jgi:cell division protein FtsN